jgi:hypothetical protein
MVTSTLVLVAAVFSLVVSVVHWRWVATGRLTERRAAALARFGSNNARGTVVAIAGLVMVTGAIRVADGRQTGWLLFVAGAIVAATLPIRSASARVVAPVSPER